ncbi:MAG: hypothetical protein ACFFBP_14565 [Promethearchaeota archaeon]
MPANYFSKKRNLKQTFSISDNLKKRIDSYVKKMHNDNPEDERYRSVSSFIFHSMEKLMDLYEKKKTLDDFNKVVDSELDNIYDNITFRAIIPLFESISEYSKYYISNLLLKPEFFYKYTELFVGQGVNGFERIKAFGLQNNLTKGLRFDLLGKKIIFEYSGYYPNLHYNLSKEFVAIMGAIGIRITDIIYSREDIYARFEAELTKSAGSKDFNIDERFKLIEHNQKFLCNYKRILSDERHHFWLTLSKEDNCFIMFQNMDEFKRLIDEILTDIKEYSVQEEIPQYILKVFKNLNWIHLIENQDTYSFRFTIDVDKYKNEITYFLNLLQNYARVEESGGMYHIQKYEDKIYINM